MVKSTIKAKGLNDMGLSRIDGLGHQDRHTPPYNQSYRYTFKSNELRFLSFISAIRGVYL